MKIGNGEFFHGDCLQVMASIPDGSVDFICTDLPWGRLDNTAWDIPIDLNRLFEHFWRIAKPNAAIALFGGQPFTSHMITSQPAHYRHNWVWEKQRTGNFGNANKMHLNGFEDICIWYRSLPTYNPQGIAIFDEPIEKERKGKDGDAYNRKPMNNEYRQYATGYPNGVIRFTKAEYDKYRYGDRGKDHDIHKPVILLDYLVRTYTNEGDVVLDATAGTGGLAKACEVSNRRWICIEQDAKFYKDATDGVKAFIDRHNDLDRRFE